MKFKGLLIILFFNVHFNFAQDVKIDSCLNLGGHDTLKIVCLMDQVSSNYRKDLQYAIDCSKKALKIADQLGDAFQQQKAEGWLGYLYYSKGEYDISMGYNKKSLQHRLEIGKVKSIINAYNNLGQDYMYLGYIDSSTLMYEKAFNLKDEINDTSYHITLYANLSKAYFKQRKTDKALRLCLDAYNIASSVNDTVIIISSLTNYVEILQHAKQFESAIERVNELIKLTQLSGDKMNEMKALNQLAVIYTLMEDFDNALKTYEAVLEFVESKGIAIAISTVSMNIGTIYSGKNEHDLALKYYEKSLEINLKNNYKSKLTACYNNIGGAYFSKKNYQEAIKYYELGKKYAKEFGNTIRLNMAFKNLGNSYLKVGDYKNSAINYYSYVQLNDSLKTEENKKQVLELSKKFETEKKELQIKNLEAQSELDSIQKAKDDEQIKLTNAQKKAQRTSFIIGGSALGIIALFFIVIAVSRKKTNRKLSSQNDQINEQKNKILDQKYILEEKNTEITDSINYAFRIQSAILPPLKQIDKAFPNVFVLYKPKDIVAGDFYWMHENINAKGNKVSYIAAADCTGHGVPGAMVSVICNNGLNRSVKEFGCKEPGAILDKTRSIVIQEFEKSEEEVKDGMDIALVSLTELDTKGKYELQYSGANNPLWIVKNSANSMHGLDEKEGVSKYESTVNDKYTLFEIKANKQPIGQFDYPEPYTTHTIQLEAGDSFYIFSDGFADQFGGVKGKKFKTKNFKELIVSAVELDLNAQKEKFDAELETWRGSIEQLDDVCVIGVRI